MATRTYETRVYQNDRTKKVFGEFNSLEEAASKLEHKNQATFDEVDHATSYSWIIVYENGNQIDDLYYI